MHSLLKRNLFSQWKRPAVIFLVLFLFTATETSTAETDPRIKAIYDFLWSRIQANNVVEYTYMTEGLKDHYRNNRGVKIRRQSGRLVSFQFHPRALNLREGSKTFEVQIAGTWKNLNDHLIGEVDEKITFVQTPRGWLADKIKFEKERPVAQAVVEGFGAAKEYRDALHVLKNVMRAWNDRDALAAVQFVSPDFVRQFKSREDLLQFLGGVSNPHPVAYVVRRIGKGNRDEVDFDVTLYEQVTGDPRLISSEAKIEVKRVGSSWFVDSWARVDNSPSSAS